MKKLILLLGSLIYSISSSSQYFNFIANKASLDKYEILDSAYMRCSYQLSYLKNPLKPKNVSKDIQILLIGNKVSKYYSQYALDYLEYVNEYVKTHDNFPNTSTKGAWSYQLFKNYPQGKEFVADVASMLQADYFYEEDIPAFEWKIENKDSTVLNYICQKATTNFRGRDFVAWFTTKIPVPNGPWKFGQLPGLILCLYDTQNNFVYECTGIESLKKKQPIVLYSLKYVKLSRIGLDKLYKRFHADLGEFLNVSTGSKLDASAYPGGKMPPISYNPIELE